MFRIELTHIANGCTFTVIKYSIEEYSQFINDYINERTEYGDPRDYDMKMY